MAVIAAVNRCATQKQEQNRVGPQSAETVPSKTIYNRRFWSACEGCLYGSQSGISAVAALRSLDVSPDVHRKQHSRSRSAVHNLKNIDFEVEHNTLTVVTGVSGSGKSSLAFDTIYAEGQRRYVESLSAYARQFWSGSRSRTQIPSMESRRRWRSGRRIRRAIRGRRWLRPRKFMTICGCCLREWAEILREVRA